MRVVAKKTTAKDLRPGDLFSTGGPDYWAEVASRPGVIGERVYVRTDQPCPAGEENEVVYRLVVEP